MVKKYALYKNINQNKEGGRKMDYTKIKEIGYFSNIEDVNKKLKENWLLILITTNKDNNIEYLLGRI